MYEYPNTKDFIISERNELANDHYYEIFIAVAKWCDRQEQREKTWTRIKRSAGMPTADSGDSLLDFGHEAGENGLLRFDESVVFQGARLSEQKIAEKSARSEVSKTAIRISL